VVTYPAGYEGSTGHRADDGKLGLSGPDLDQERRSQAGDDRQSQKRSVGHTTNVPGAIRNVTVCVDNFTTSAPFQTPNFRFMSRFWYL
jgi:hypothetical protein